MAPREPVRNYITRVFPWQRDQIPANDESHDELMRVFRKYFQAHTQWHRTGSKTSAGDMRFWLVQIVDAARFRRLVVKDWQKFVANKDNVGKPTPPPRSPLDQDTKTKTKRKMQPGTITTMHKFWFEQFLKISDPNEIIVYEDDSSKDVDTENNMEDDDGI